MSVKVVQPEVKERFCDLCDGQMDGRPRSIHLTKDQSAALFPQFSQSSYPTRGRVALRCVSPNGSEVNMDLCARCIAPFLRRLERLICYGETS